MPPRYVTVKQRTASVNQVRCQGYSILTRPSTLASFHVQNRVNALPHATYTRRRRPSPREPFLLANWNGQCVQHPVRRSHCSNLPVLAQRSWRPSCRQQEDVWVG